MKSLPPALALALALCFFSGCDEDDVATPDGQVTPADTGGAPKDGGAADALTGPWAQVFNWSPTADKRKTTAVKLTNITDASGKLTGKYVNAWNCTQDDKGKKINLDLGGMKISGIICTQKQTALPDSAGTYLQYNPPQSDISGKDTFAELMMYHHVNTFHDHLSKSFGLKHLDKKSLRAIVNLQGKVDLLPSWVGLPNAAFMPASSSDLLKQYGVDLLQGEDGIIFGYNNLMTPYANFAWDAGVIYHEYNHYAVGSALWRPAADKYGVDPTPKGLNEALADYMPCSFTGNTKMGEYALGSSARDLTRNLKCPDHIVGEEHRDGEVASGALWAARTVVGKDVLDKAIWKAVITFTASTTFSEAATAILDELKKSAPTKEAAVKKIFTDRGMLSCVRVRDHKDISGGGSYGPGFPGTASGVTGYSKWIPGYMQYKVKVLSTTKELTINYTPSSGGLMGVGSSKADVSVAFKRGGTPITYTYLSSGLLDTSDAEVTLKGADDGKGGYTLKLSGSCLTQGDLIYQFISNGSQSGSVSAVSVTQSATKTNTTDNYTKCL